VRGISDVQALQQLGLNICREPQVYGKAEEGADDGGYEPGQGCCGEGAMAGIGGHGSFW